MKLLIIHLITVFENFNSVTHKSFKMLKNSDVSLTSPSLKKDKLKYHQSDFVFSSNNKRCKPNESRKRLSSVSMQEKTPTNSSIHPAIDNISTALSQYNDLQFSYQRINPKNHYKIHKYTHSLILYTFKYFITAQ